MAQSFRELAVQSPNVTYSTDDLTNIKAEVTEMQSQITSIKSNAEFNGIKRFDGTAGTSGTVTVQVGANAADTVDLSFTEIDLDDAVASTLFDDPSAALATLTTRSEEHTSELQSLMRISYAVFCLNKKNKIQIHTNKLRITTLKPINHRSMYPLTP